MTIPKKYKLYDKKQGISMKGILLCQFVQLEHAIQKEVVK